MKIDQVDIHSESYSKLINEVGGVFNSKTWLSVYGDSLEVNGIFDKGGQLIGVFNLFKDKKYRIPHISNPPFSPNIGLIFKNKSSNPAKSRSFEKSIMRLLQEYLTKYESGLITIALPEYCIDTQPFIWENYKVIPNYTYQLTLKKLTIDQVNKSFSPERRNDVKKAIADGVTSRLTKDFSTIKKMVGYTYNRKEKQLKEELLDSLLSKYTESNQCYSVVSYKDEVPLAATFVVFDNRKAYYLLGGYDPKHKHQGAGALAVTESIKKSIELGLEIFDFEGSMLPEVEKYFRGFGGEMTPYFTLNKAPFLMEVALKYIDKSRF